MDLKKARVAVLVEQQYQEMEVWYPIYRLREAGCKVTLVGPEAGTSYASKLGYPAKSDKAAKEVTPDDFDALVIPGGFAPDFLRRHEAVIIEKWESLDALKAHSQAPHMSEYRVRVQDLVESVQLQILAPA